MLSIACSRRSKYTAVYYLASWPPTVSPHISASPKSTHFHPGSGPHRNLSGCPRAGCFSVQGPGSSDVGAELCRRRQVGWGHHQTQACGLRQGFPNLTGETGPLPGCCLAVHFWPLVVNEEEDGGPRLTGRSWEERVSVVAWLWAAGRFFPGLPSLWPQYILAHLVLKMLRPLGKKALDFAALSELALGAKLSKGSQEQASSPRPAQRWPAALLLIACRARTPRV